MVDGEWILEYTGVSYHFGTYASGIMLADAPDLGQVDLRVDDVPMPRGDGRLFGVDYQNARTITLELLVFADTEADTRELVDGLLAAWRGDWVRTRPGELAGLRTRNAGREREVFGRPRRIAV